MILLANGPLEAAATSVLLARAAEEGLVLVRHLRQPRTARVDHGRAPVAAGHVAAVAADQTQRVPAVGLPGLQVEIWC